jgi:hypothetical protein
MDTSVLEKLNSNHKLALCFDRRKSKSDYYSAFGSCIDVADATTINILSSLPLDYFRHVGNTTSTVAWRGLLLRSH